MKILYDNWIFNKQRFGGISKCFCELISHRPQGETYEIPIATSNNIHLAESGLVKGLKKMNVDMEEFQNAFGGIKGTGRLYNYLLRIPIIPFSERENIKRNETAIRRGNYDVLHVTSFLSTYFFKYLPDKPFVCTIHDMTHERFSNYFKNSCKVTEIKRKLCERAAAIICVSKQTKSDLQDILNIPEEKIHVIYHGGPNPVQIKENAIVDGAYFLFVGMRGGYKNFFRTLEDFKVFSEKHDEVRLVCTAKPFTRKELKHIADLGLSNKVLQLSVSDRELKNLYTYAQAFIYPSLYEGFGIPTLESFAQGCPCLLNDNSCFPEVGGKAAFYFHSDGVISNLPDVMEQVYTLSDAERIAIIKKGYEQLSKFTWSEASKKLWGVYHNIVGHSNISDNQRVIGGGKCLEYKIARTLSVHVELKNCAA